jgi:hypothetical protein
MDMFLQFPLSDIGAVAKFDPEWGRYTKSALYLDRVAGLSRFEAALQYTSLVYSEFISTEHENYPGTLKT